MDLSNLEKKEGNTKKAKRVGRGCGSGKGMHTTGSGQKGQLSRTGKHLPVGHEGGQIPLFKRLPHIEGFKNPRRKQISIVSLGIFNDFRKGSVVTPQDLIEKGILNNIPKYGVKILGNGTLDKELTFSGFLMSASVKATIEKTGSKVLNG